MPVLEWTEVLDPDAAMQYTTPSKFMGSLPPEILTAIFQAYVDDAGGLCTLPGNAGPVIPPNILGRVCRLWRDLTFSPAAL